MYLPGSYSNGFAPRDAIPRYPGLWRGCVGAWAPCLGPTGATLRDWAGGSHHGTLTSMDPGTDWVISGGGYALDFDGTDDHVLMGATLSQLGEMTVAGWFRTTTVALGTRCIIANEVGGANEDYSLEINRTAARLSILWGGVVQVTGNAAISTNTWYHAAATRSGTTGAWTATLYLNGALDNSAATASNPNGGSATLAIGRLGALALFRFSGQLDDIALWNRALHPSEIRLLAQRRGIMFDHRDRRRVRIVDDTNRRRRFLMACA